MATFWNWIMEGGHVWLGIAGILLGAAVHFALSRQRSGAWALELLLMYSMGVAGFRGIFNGFLMHIVWADQLAESIGWPAGNPFQMEVAFANLAIGVLGALCFFRRDVWLPYLIASTIFAWGAGFTHIVDMVNHGNFAPNNAGPILWADFLIPAARILLYVLWRRVRAPEVAAPPRAMID